MADTGNIKLNTVAEKLEHEKKQFLATITADYKAVAETQCDMVFSAMIKKCKEDSGLEASVLQEHKTWGKCMAFLAKKAYGIRKPSEEEKRLARTGEVPIAVPMSSEILFEWIEEYYRRDDKAEEEKAAKKKKAEEQKQKMDSDTNGQVKKPSVKEDKFGKQKPVKKSKPKEDNGQMSLFDFLE